MKTLARRALARGSRRDKTHSDNRAEPGQLEPLVFVSGVSITAWSDKEEERAASIEYDGGATRAWAEALARLDPVRAPCDISPKRWLRFIDDCGRFLDGSWAARANELGWGPLELFGCDRVKPFARLDRAGVLWLLDGSKVVALAP